MAENLYEREKLYNEVWDEPVYIVAKRYGVSNVMIKKICKKMNIPVPPPGYWARLQAGQKMKKTPLPSHKGPNTVRGSRSDSTEITSKESHKPEEIMPLAFLDESERQRVIEVTSEIQAQEELRRSHVLIREHRDEMKERRKRERERNRSCFYGSSNYRNQQEKDKNVLAISVSKNSTDRAYRILNQFIRTLEELNCNVIVDEKDGLSYAIVRNEKLQLSLTEPNKRIQHVITPQEEARQAKDKYFTPPKYDYVNSGEFTFTLNSPFVSKRDYRDTKTKSLESQLREIIIDLFEASERIRLARVEREREEERRRQEAERRHRLAQLQQEEMEDVEALENEISDWHKAARIREYVAAVEKALEKEADQEVRESTLKWIKWAKDKADWYDPIIDKEDPVLGKRNHSEKEGKRVELVNPYGFFR